MFNVLCLLLSILCSTPVEQPNSLVSPTATHTHQKHVHVRHVHTHTATVSKQIQQARRKALDELFPEVARRVQALHKKPTSELPTAVTGHCKMNKCRDCKHTEKSGIQRCKPTLCTHKDCPYAPSSQSPIPRNVQDRMG